MRDYSKVSAAFWTGSTGKLLRSEPEAQIVAMYLMTCPHANMIGLFHCPVAYISHDTGIPFEGALKGLRRVIDAHFCTQDADRDLIWVHEMARFQIGEALKPNDNRIVNVAKELASAPKCLLSFGFYDRYANDYLLHDRLELDGLRRAFEGASDPLRSQKQKQEQKQKQKQEQKKEPSQGGEITELGTAGGKGKRPALAVVNGNGFASDGGGL